MNSLLVLGVFALSLFLNIPIAFALGIATIITILATGIVPLGFAIQAYVTSGDSFPLLAIPFFTLAGDIMARGGVSGRLVDFGRKLFGGMTGSLGVVTIFVCAIFAAISGSGPATVAAIGGIMIPAMASDGYDKAFAASLAAAGGTLGPIIPPSICFVIYGIIANVSITDLFIAGVVPGLLMALSLMTLAWYYARTRGFGTRGRISSWKEIVRSFNNAKWSLLVPVIVLGGIYGGVFTATEAAVIACVYGLILGLFVYKELDIKDLPAIIARSSLTMGTAVVMVGCATAFGYLLTILQVPASVSSAIQALTSNRYVILLLINMLLFVVGCLMETLSAIIILAPLLLEIVKPYGVTPLHFGLIMVINLVIGQCTPPVAVNLFVASSIADTKIDNMVKWILPMIVVLYLDLMVITYVPSVGTFLVDLLR